MSYCRSKNFKFRIVKNFKNTKDPSFRKGGLGRGSCGGDLLVNVSFWDRGVG